MKSTFKNALLVTLFAACAAQAGQPAQVVVVEPTNVDRAIAAAGVAVTAATVAPKGFWSRFTSGAKYYGNVALDGIKAVPGKLKDGGKRTLELAKANPKVAIAIAAAATAAAGYGLYRWYTAEPKMWYDASARLAAQLAAAPAAKPAAQDKPACSAGRCPVAPVKAVVAQSTETRPGQVLIKGRWHLASRLVRRGS